jgi:hypothetical protein
MSNGVPACSGKEAMKEVMCGMKREGEMREG